MSDSFRQASGRKVVSRASARELGAVSHLLVDAEQRRIAAVIIGRGKKARLVDWAQVSGFGPDAIMVGDEGALRAPADDRERAGADGKLELVGKRALTERGNELGRLDDVTFDPGTGAVEMLHIGDREVPAGSLLGSGPYAVVLDAGHEPAPQFDAAWIGGGHWVLDALPPQRLAQEGGGRLGITVPWCRRARPAASSKTPTDLAARATGGLAAVGNVTWGDVLARPKEEPSETANPRRAWR